MLMVIMNCSAPVALPQSVVLLVLAPDSPSRVQTLDSALVGKFDNSSVLNPFFP